MTARGGIYGDKFGDGSHVYTTRLDYTASADHPDPCPACKGSGEGPAGDCPCAECMKRPTYRDHSINPL